MMQKLKGLAFPKRSHVMMGRLKFLKKLITIFNQLDKFYLIQKQALSENYKAETILDNFKKSYRLFIANLIKTDYNLVIPTYECKNVGCQLMHHVRNES